MSFQLARCPTEMSCPSATLICSIFRCFTSSVMSARSSFRFCPRGYSVVLSHRRVECRKCILAIKYPSQPGQSVEVDNTTTCYRKAIKRIYSTCRNDAAPPPTLPIQHSQAQKPSRPARYIPELQSPSL